MNKIFTKLKKYLFGFIYAIPFGMKQANNEMFYNKASSDSDGTMISQNIENGTVCDDLLNARVTQEVRNLRYRTYLAAEESRKYKYYGGDRGKKEIFVSNIDENSNIISFKLPNKIICDSIKEELKRVNKYGEPDEFTLKIKTEGFPTFKLERYIDFVSVYINKEKKEYIVRFLYPKDFPKRDVKRRILCNVFKNKDFRCKDIFQDIVELEFITSKTEGIPDFMKFNFYNLKIRNFIDLDDENYFIVEYKTEKYKSENLIEKYFEADIDKKYKNKEKKNNTYKIQNIESKLNNHYCEHCKKIISEFDAEMSKESVGKELCIDCLAKEAIK